MRIGTADRPGAVRHGTADAARGPAERGAEETRTPPARALVVLDGGRRDGPAASRGDGRPEAGFIAQLIAAADPALQPSRLARTRAASALYAAMARRLA